ncbi:MAG: hypothetical protein UIC64_09695 [Agathobacter sp.]|nr:hypothetical protein [Agathobacter sp.]
MKNLKLISNILLTVSLVALTIGASFHGYRIHPENEAHYQLGVTMGIVMISIFAIFLCVGIVCRILARRKKE